MLAPRRILLIILVLLLLLLFVVVPGVSYADAFQDAARELAKKIVALAGPRQAITLSIRNNSSLADSEVSAVRRALETELGAAGLRLADKPNGALELRITLSENVQGLLWVAELLRDTSREVVLISISSPTAQATRPAESPFVVHTQLVWESEKPILDFTVLSAPDAEKRQLLVLSPQSISLFDYENLTWCLQQSLPIPQTVAWPRDLRGRLELSDPAFTAYLPGMKCEGRTGPSFRVQCDPVMQEEELWNLSGVGEDPVAARFVARRNFFEGSLPLAPKADLRIPPFFTVVALGEAENYFYWILAGTDGRARIYTEDVRKGQPQLTQTLADWGSELAPIRSECGRHEQLLATRPGDWTETDAVQAYELVDGKAVSVSTPTQFAGPVSALWADEQGDVVRAIVRNLKTERYEAYTLTLSCGR